MPVEFSPEAAVAFLASLKELPRGTSGGLERNESDAQKDFEFIKSFFSIADDEATILTWVTGKCGTQCADACALTSRSVYLWLATGKTRLAIEAIKNCRDTGLFTAVTLADGKELLASKAKYPFLALCLQTINNSMRLVLPSFDHKSCASSSGRKVDASAIGRKG